jgi:hypothetical protein
VLREKREMQNGNARYCAVGFRTRRPFREVTDVEFRTSREALVYLTVPSDMALNWIGDMDTLSNLLLP